MTTPTIHCRDRFEGFPLSVLPGRDCDVLVPGPGWACPEHHAAAHAILDTLITDVPDEREVRNRAKAQPMDPEIRALIAEATAYLTECATRERNADFIDSLLHDPKYGTKWLRVTENMARAILRTRDHARQVAAPVETQPRLDEAKAWIDANATRDEFASNLRAGLARYGRLTDRQYEAVIRNVDRAPRPETTHEAAPEGWYKVGEAIFKVQKAVHGSGQVYAKRLVVDGTDASWVYEPGMVRRLTPDQRLTTEDAAAFGRLYGICAVCGATLTDEASIERGIGPICITRLG